MRKIRKKQLSLLEVKGKLDALAYEEVKLNLTKDECNNWKIVVGDFIEAAEKYNEPDLLKYAKRVYDKLESPVSEMYFWEAGNLYNMVVFWERRNWRIIWSGRIKSFFKRIINWRPPRIQDVINNWISVLNSMYNIMDYDLSDMEGEYF